jgi:hypothetical protein
MIVSGTTPFMLLAAVLDISAILLSARDEPGDQSGSQMLAALAVVFVVTCILMSVGQ